MAEAERIARFEHRSHKVAVISGVGTRHYYRCGRSGCVCVCVCVCEGATLLQVCKECVCGYGCGVCVLV